jgi:hypothetical protein
MKFDFLCEFDYKSCYLNDKSNWLIKEKPKLDPIDLILSEEVYEFIEDDTKDKKEAVTWHKNKITMYYFRHLKNVYKNAEELEALDYISWCLYHFNKRFKNKKQLDEYFGR